MMFSIKILLTCAIIKLASASANRVNPHDEDAMNRLQLASHIVVGEDGATLYRDKDTSRVCRKFDKTKSELVKVTIPTGTKLLLRGNFIIRAYCQNEFDYISDALYVCKNDGSIARIDSRTGLRIEDKPKNLREENARLNAALGRLAQSKAELKAALVGVKSRHEELTSRIASTLKINKQLEQDLDLSYRVQYSVCKQLDELNEGKQRVEAENERLKKVEDAAKAMLTEPQRKMLLDGLDQN